MMIIFYFTERENVSLCVLAKKYKHMDQLCGQFNSFICTKYQVRLFDDVEHSMLLLHQHQKAVISYFRTFIA